MTSAAEKQAGGDVQSSEPSRDGGDRSEAPFVPAEVVYEQTLETLRSEHSSLVTESTILSLILVTMVGFAIERQSWGIAAAAVIVYPAKLLSLGSWKRRSRGLLAVAADLEPANARLAGSLLVPAGDFTGRRWHWLIVVVVGAIHVVVVVQLRRTGWNFEGS